ncbi:MAG: SPFH domain-containing protein, partial [Gemmatimonadota bacterium]|nr:SPFH domain-containing protein [Gemmatimonadota bacterium]
DPWGIEVTAVEIKDIDLPKEMKRAMAKQAEAERERRGKVIAAEGEFQASRKLSAAAKVISQHPVALQLRFLQTVVEVAAENNSTTLFPIPVDLFAPFLERATGVPGGGFPSQLSKDDARALAAAAVESLGAGSDEVAAALEAGDAKQVLEGAKKALGLTVGSGEDESGGADASAEGVED